MIAAVEVLVILAVWPAQGGLRGGTGPGSAAILRAEESSRSIWATGELIRCGGGRG